jgi:hypothetical protein
MKANAIPPQAPPVVEACPWCDGDLIVADATATCDACAIEVPLAEDRPLVAAA